MQRSNKNSRNLRMVVALAAAETFSNDASNEEEYAMFSVTSVTLRLA